MNSSLRVALFTDSFQEANGVATFSRNLAHFTHQEDIPFLCVHGSKQTRVRQERFSTTVELKRSLASFPLDRGLYFDPLLNRHRNWAVGQLQSFKADLVHITGPGDVGILGFWAAHILRIPLVASWHTNLHEYVARRLDHALRRTPARFRERITGTVEGQSLRGLMRFYRLPSFLLAPNRSMVDLLQERTGRPAFLMGHGVDLQRYSPRPAGTRNVPFCIGYVGRLTPEKNARYFAELERNLVAAGETNFRFLLVGEGSEEKWLKQNLRLAEFPGVLRDEELAAAFANMDAFVFPSRTDTFGLVLLEAMASGVPVVLSPVAGTRLGMADGEGGYLAEDFTECVLRLMRNDTLRRNLGVAARQFACSRGWRDVFRDLYLTYEKGLQVEDGRRAIAEARKARGSR